MTLPKLLQDLAIATTSSVPDVAVESVTDDSRRCGPGALFVAVVGTRADGHDYLPEAARRGAAAALVGRHVEAPPDGLPIVEVADPRRALALVAQRLAGDPTHAMRVVGVTGTNGKTTVTYLLEAIFEAAGWPCGVLGTIEDRWGGRARPASQTTPSPTDLAEMLDAMRRDGVRAVAMEVSSHALDQRRADGVCFDAVGLTNLTQDHLDYHETMETYARAKQRLFTELAPQTHDAVSVLNADDPAGRRFAEAARTTRVWTYSLRPESDAFAHVEAIREHERGISLTLRTADGAALELETPLHGAFNVHNCTMAALLALGAGVDGAAVRRGIAAMRTVPGRFESIDAGQSFRVFVDYAHTPDSLEQVLANARPLVREPDGRLIVVFGCGGDRDTGKRPLMGGVAARGADRIWITNDNPRTEAPAPIAEAIERGVRDAAPEDLRWRVVLDRARAIGDALAAARAGDVVVIAGKGHEDYQLLGDRTIHFDDREVARAALDGLSA